MVKWKTLSSLFVFLVVLLTYRKFDQFKQHINTTSDTYIKTILVFIHIQKTAGSEFERSIVRRLKFGLNSSCHCPSSSLLADQRKYGRVKLRCNCSNTEKQPWFVSRFSVGWLCGVHADWTTYHRCVAQKFDADFGVEKRRFVYGTLLREPIDRFISEYLHTLRGANWLTERFYCSKAQQLRNENSCWKKPNLTEFIACPFNSAVNRQTRMLSSIKSDCSSENFQYHDMIDLETAKSNLESMEFFGLTEELSLSQRLFEATRFCRTENHRCSFETYLEQKSKNQQTSDFIQNNLTSNDLDRLRQLNSDDIELYRFARQLFFQRTCRILSVACE